MIQRKLRDKAIKKDRMYIKRTQSDRKDEVTKQRRDTEREEALIPATFSNQTPFTASSYSWHNKPRKRKWINKRVADTFGLL